MIVHEEILQILACYRDASAEERLRADVHIASCAACATKLADYGKVDGALKGLAMPVLPARLGQPLSTVLAVRGAGSNPHKSLGFRFTRTFAPVAIVFVLLVALSAIILSVNAGRIPVSSTPTLTTTLTPTTISARQTQPAIFTGFDAAAPLLGMPGFAVTPAPVPAPIVGNEPSILLAGYTAHARIIR